MYPKNFELTTLSAQFIIASLRATINQKQWNYVSKLTRTDVLKMTIHLPLKPNTNPNNYTQSDIDWDYMEKFMENMQNKAKARLDKLSVNFTN